MSSSSVRSILIVEDEIGILDLLTEELRDSGYTVYPAETAEDGLRILENTPGIDLLFTDIRLPGKMDGWDLAERARAARPDIRIIYATGFSGVPSRIMPGAQFFKKPYPFSRVFEAIAAL